MKNYISFIVIASFISIVCAEDYCGKYNCYQLLSVDQDADQITIKKAFRQMAKRYHPDKNQAEDTTQFFQFINKAYQILIDEKSRFKYNLHLRNPQESDYYHQYQYYSHKYIQNPQIHPALVVLLVIVLVSTLQFVMRKQMYERAILQITESNDFKVKVNQKWINKKNKDDKERIRQKLISQIQIEGGYSKPQIKDIFAVKIALFPYLMYLFLRKKITWFYNYRILKKQYTSEDKIELTINALKIKMGQWINIDDKEKKDLLDRQLWIKDNKKKYDQEMRQRWLEKIKEDNPRKYQMIVKHLKKTQ